MNKQQSGFTLIELIAVIVILGILAAVAVPRFSNLQTAARAGAAEGIAGGLGSSSAMNYATGLASSAGVSGATAVDTSGGCTSTVANSLMDPGSQIDFTNDYTISGGSTFTDADGSGDDTVGDYVTCTIADANDSNATASFTLYYTT